MGAGFELPAPQPLTAQDDPALHALVERIADARARKQPLRIVGGDSKRFYGNPPRGEPLRLGELRGISSHEPSELVVTVRAGTPLRELEAALAEHGQCLPFEPPRYRYHGADAEGTVGGMVAAGLAGPARAASGGVRDFVLGATLLNGRGELLSFGGQVMKNVAGYDVSRLLAGSLGVLGVICEVSLKVLPVPPARATLRFGMDQATALQALNRWAGRPLPLSASAWWEGTLLLRLAGAEAAVAAACDELGGEPLDADAADDFWTGLRDHRDEFFIGALRAAAHGAALWRLSVPPTTPPLELSGEQLVEWGGAQRWLCTSMPAAGVRQAAAQAGGHATLFLAEDKSAGAFAPLEPALARIHQRLKQAFDPDGLFNPGRLYPEL
jgi:glycolate oxidase FAD binding subunit